MGRGSALPRAVQVPPPKALDWRPRPTEDLRVIVGAAIEWRLERTPAWLVRAVPIDLRELAPVDKRLVRDAEIAPSVCLRLMLAVMCEN